MRVYSLRVRVLVLLGLCGALVACFEMETPDDLDEDEDAGEQGPLDAGSGDALDSGARDPRDLDAQVLGNVEDNSLDGQVQDAGAHDATVAVDSNPPPDSGDAGMASDADAGSPSSGDGGDGGEGGGPDNSDPMCRGRSDAGDTTLPVHVCRVDCISTLPSSDVMVTIVQKEHASGEFTAHVVQTQPEAIDITFTEVGAGWSGHFFNFGDATSKLPLKFHLLTRGEREKSNNVEVYTNDTNYDGAPVNVNELDCTLQRNH